MLEKLKSQKKLKMQNSEQINVEKKPRRKVSKQNLSTLIGAILLVLAHVAVLLAIFLSFRYYSIYPALFGSLVCIIVCVLIIIDIVFFVGMNHKDIGLKILTCILAFLLLSGGTVGSYFVARANGIVSNVLGSNSSSKYETYSGVFVSYDKYNKFTSLEDLKGKKVGLLNETSNGISYIARSILKEAGVDYGEIDYNTNTELVTALVDGEIDAMVITSAYRNMYSLERDENSPFAQYLDNFIDFNSFEQELKVTSDKKAKNLSNDPFNVLLIGYSRTDIGSSVGLADSIILATINPQTYTVSMMSIARDSFVPISCYGGEYDKINSGRSTSRACFIETVEDFLGMDIDYYMELDYLGLVQIVNIIGGIEITSPVEFTLDGIYVPEGTFLADGQQALQFCRERHSMPNGDFDRQQHQKEVIIKIAEKFISSGDIGLALQAMDAASDWMSTDLSLTELTQIFNLLLNTKNYTGLDTFNLVDFQTLRMTGSGGIMYYSYSMHLPLWVYLIYQGSYDESVSHINEILGKYDKYNQNSSFEFSAQNYYVRPAFYSLEYEEKFLYTPDPMPAYWANLEGMSLSEAMQWANEKGVTLTVKMITPADEGYNEELQGLIVDQSVRYGSLVSDYNTSIVTIMGAAEIDESKQVPIFVEHSYQRVIDWAERYGVKYDIDFDTDVDGKVGDVVSQNYPAYTKISDIEGKFKVVVKAGTYTITFDKNGHGTSAPDAFSVTTGDSKTSFDSSKFKMSKVSSSESDDGFEYIFKEWNTKSDGTGTTVDDSLDVSGNTTIYAIWEKNCNHVYEADTSKQDVQATCGQKGTKYLKCKICGNPKEEEIPATEQHTWDEGTEKSAPTCSALGVKTKTCTECGATKDEEYGSLLDHTFVDDQDTCTVCGAEKPTE